MIADLKPYPEYKESGLPWLGDIPAYWKVGAIGAVATLIQTGPFGSQLHSHEYVSSGIPVINPSHMVGGKLKPSPAVTIRGEKAKELSRHMLQSGDVVIARRGELGRCALVTLAEDGWICGTGSLLLRCKTSAVNPHFFQILFSSCGIADMLSLSSIGATMANLSAGTVARQRLPLPPLAEQVAIVRFLDWANGRLERAIRAKRKVIALLNEQKQAIILRAVTRGLDPAVPLKPSGIPWLGDIPRHWDTPLNQRIFRENSRPHNGSLETQLSLSQRDGLIVTRDMRERSLQTSSYDNWKVTVPGDLVLNRFKAHLGVFFAATLRGMVSFHYGVFAPLQKLHTKYFELLFHTYPYRTIYAGCSNGMTVGLQNLSNQNFYNVRSVVPPLSEQVAIVEYAEHETQTLNTAISRLECEIELLREYRTRLVADVVTGKLDVREAAARLPAEAPPEIAEDDGDPSIDPDAEDEEAVA